MKFEALTTEKKDHFTCLIYGASGTGKTTLSATFPKPIAFFDFDNKLGTIDEKKRVGIYSASYSMKSPSHGADMFEEFYRDWKKSKQNGFLLPSNEKPATIVLDSVTVMDILSLCFFVRENGGDPEKDKPTLPVYGNQASFYNSFFAGINSFPCNVVCLAHESFRQDKEGFVEGIQPLITGKGMLNKLPAIFQETWYLRKDEKSDTRYLHYKPYKQAIANSISLKGDGVIKDPTYEKIIANVK